MLPYRLLIPRGIPQNCIHHSFRKIDRTLALCTSKQHIDGVIIISAKLLQATWTLKVVAQEIEILIKEWISLEELFSLWANHSSQKEKRNQGVILWGEEYLICCHLRRWASNINSSKEITKSCICNLSCKFFIYNKDIGCLEILMYQTRTQGVKMSQTCTQIRPMRST